MLLELFSTRFHLAGFILWRCGHVCYQVICDEQISAQISPSLIFINQASKPFILSYFDKYRPQYQVYGFVPVMDAAGNEGDLAILNSENLNVFARHVDLRSILKDIWSFSAYHRRPGDLLVYQLPGFREELENSVDVETNDRPSRGAGRIGNLDPLRSIYLRDDSQKYLRTDGDSNDRDLERASKRMKLHTREEIQRVAMSSGASGG